MELFVNILRLFRGLSRSENWNVWHVGNPSRLRYAIASEMPTVGLRRAHLGLLPAPGPAARGAASASDGHGRNDYL